MRHGHRQPRHPDARPGTAPAAAIPHGVQASQEAVNKRIAIAFLDLAINHKRPREAADRYLGAPYVQHNTRIADGKDAFVAPDRPRHGGSRHPPAEERQDRRALGRTPGSAGNIGQRQHHVLSPLQPRRTRLQ
ncbi:hypothetical protein ABZ250_21445 [Streptomyces afghaniensis]|uniref:hypothetical protein n=1 Tax=Streptomyces afghaniensis TaxID=66865 RepID=UPI0033A75D48